MAVYFAAAEPADAAWAVFFLTGRRLKRLVPFAAIREWTLAATGLPAWLLDESYGTVGDGAETAALVLDQLPTEQSDDVNLATWVEERILPLKQQTPAVQQERVTMWLRQLDRWQRFILLKLITGELRLGVSQTLVVRGLAQAAGLPVTTIAARLMGDWSPTAAWYQSLLEHGQTADDLSRPYPFYLASPMEPSKHPSEIDEGRDFDPATWLVEWKWDGIRAQLIHRGGKVHLWSRGEELITHRFPEISAAAALFPSGTVLDGEILAFRDDRPLPFSALQQRIGRQSQVRQVAHSVPAVFMAFDLLEHDGRDIRDRTLAERRRHLEWLITTLPQESFADVNAERDLFGVVHALPAPAAALRVSPLVSATSWQDLATMRLDSRTHGVEGLMLKRLSSTYGVGRKRGDWWKWKIDPFTVDAVLIYAQPGSGKRASLLTDYTFGVWDNGELVPFAKAYSGLSNEEIAELDRWIRRHTRERFGPVRHVEPIHVFELGFEAIARSSRHRSGIAVRFPRMLRWRKDKRAEEADTLERIKGLLA